MNNFKINKKGFTLSEILVSMPILIILFSLVAGTYITMQKFFPGGITQVALQSYGRSALGKIANNVRASTSASVNAGGDILTITLDPNGTYTNTADDVTAQYYILGTNIIYLPDTSDASSKITLLQNVQQEASIPFFQESTNLIVITFNVTSTNILLGTQNCALSTSITRRN